MKKALLAALFVTVISSWCLAQTDSLPAPTAEPCQPAACSGPCQTGACAVPCKPAVCAEPFAPKWAVGLKTYSISDLPGSVIVEKMFGVNNAVRLIVNGDYQKDNDYYIYKKWWVEGGVKWFHRFNFNRFEFIKPSLGFGLIYNREEYKYQYSSNSNYHCDYANVVQLSVPLALIHYFKVAENNFAAGVEANIFEVEAEQSKGEERDIFTGNTHVVGPSTVIQASLFSKPYLVIKYIFK